ncbi:MAG: hypothetical protein CM1200mP39_02560 [Dehalococcoidia bacterium]|nr:MAG: hypothetical protein CM1200mP39_02560 [Dehalococcoidia bacterium]
MTQTLKYHPLDPDHNSGSGPTCWILYGFKNVHGELRMDVFRPVWNVDNLYPIGKVEVNDIPLNHAMQRFGAAIGILLK